MNASAAVALMTTEDLLALPEDPDVERELIRGQLVEHPVTRRNPKHSGVTVNVAYSLNHWLKGRPKPRGRVLAGEAGFRIRRDPDTTVGIDVAYISAELDEATPSNARLVDGIPVLAVQILSPSDRQEEITAKDRGVPGRRRPAGVADRPGVLHGHGLPSRRASGDVCRGTGTVRRTAPAGFSDSGG